MVSFQLSPRLRLALFCRCCWMLLGHFASANHASPPSKQVHRQRFLKESTTCTASCCQKYMNECAVGNDTESKILAAVPFPAQIALIALLLFITAAFAGLTLGLMGLDRTGLEIIMDSDDKVNADRARRIYPFRQRGNLLLCTLVLGNIAANSLLSILMADKAGGLVGFLSATFLIVIFGEIIPQAACSRYSLAIGSASIPLVRLVLVLLYPIAYPLSWVLDKALGKEIATTYSTSELMKLLQIHVSENALDAETAVAMTGALKYKNVAVKDVMTPIESAFMLSVNDRLNYETITRIFKTGYSRIPVYKTRKDNVIGLLFVKDLIFIDPEDETPVADILDIFGRSTHVAQTDDRLGDVLKELKKGRSHMALVHGNKKGDEEAPSSGELQGIITLEDIIEEILGDEIVDETDAAERTKDDAEDREEKLRWAKLRMLDAKIVEQTLCPDETRAVTAHLLLNYRSVVSLLTENQLFRLIAETPISILPAADQKIGQILPDDLLYKRNTKADFATLIITGKVTVESGVDCFRTDVSSWALLGRGALVDSNYSPDFTAFVSSGPCRCILIKRARYAAAVDASAMERRAKKQADSEPEVTAPTETTALLPKIV